MRRQLGSIGLAALSVVFLVLPVLIGCGGNDRGNAADDAASTDGGDVTPTLSSDAAPSHDSGADSDVSPGDSNNDSVPVVGQFPCEDLTADGFLQITLDSQPCVADRTEQCSIVGDGRTGLIRSSSQLEWSSLDDAVLKANIGGQVVEATGTVVVSGAVLDMWIDGELFVVSARELLAALWVVAEPGA